MAIFQVNKITSITNPQGRCTLPLPAATVPTPNAVSCQLGTIDAVGTNSYNFFVRYCGEYAGINWFNREQNFFHDKEVVVKFNMET